MNTNNHTETLRKLFPVAEVSVNVDAEPKHCRVSGLGEQGSAKKIAQLINSVAEANWAKAAEDGALLIEFTDESNLQKRLDFIQKFSRELYETQFVPGSAKSRASYETGLGTALNMPLNMHRGTDGGDSGNYELDLGDAELANVVRVMFDLLRNAPGLAQIDESRNTTIIVDASRLFSNTRLEAPVKPDAVFDNLQTILNNNEQIKNSKSKAAQNYLAKQFDQEPAEKMTITCASEVAAQKLSDDLKRLSGLAGKEHQAFTVSGDAVTVDTQILPMGAYLQLVQKSNGLKIAAEKCKQPAVRSVG